MVNGTGEAHSPVADTVAPPKKGLKLSYDEYKQLANLLVLYIRRKEEDLDGKGGEREDMGGGGVQWIRL